MGSATMTMHDIMKLRVDGYCGIRLMIVALAHKLPIALWRFSETGLVPTGATLV